MKGGLQHSIEPWLVDRCPPGFDLGYPFRVDVDANGFEATVGERDCGTEPDISETDEGNALALCGHDTRSSFGSSELRFADCHEPRQEGVVGNLPNGRHRDLLPTVLLPALSARQTASPTNACASRGASRFRPVFSPLAAR